MKHLPQEEINEYARKELQESYNGRKNKKFSEIVVNKFQRLKKLYKKVQNKQSNQRCYLAE